MASTNEEARVIGISIGSKLAENLQPETTGHIQVVLEATEIFAEKNALRGDMWREFPPSDKIRELGERVRRIEKMYDRLQHGGSHLTDTHLLGSIEQDGLDLINYTVFMIRQLREGARG